MGHAYSGYIARFNYVLKGGYKQGRLLRNQHFDVHGTRATNDYGGYGRRRVLRDRVQHRSAASRRITPAQDPTGAMLRGNAGASGATFNDNVAVHDDLDEAVSFKTDSKNDTGSDEDHDDVQLPCQPATSYDTDYTTEIAAGDFDGDGRTDVFLANGTAWFYSRGGIGQWGFLRPSNKRIGDLGFADIDNDGITDVLYRGRRRQARLREERHAPTQVPPHHLPVPDQGPALRRLRRRRPDGHLLHAAAAVDDLVRQHRAWSPRQTSSTSDLRAALRRVRRRTSGTDVVAVERPVVVLQRRRAARWARLNGKLTRSFTDAVAADFDGNGRTRHRVSAAIRGPSGRSAYDGR